jgi:hypothetical protein
MSRRFDSDLIDAGSEFSPKLDWTSSTIAGHDDRNTYELLTDIEDWHESAKKFAVDNGLPPLQEYQEPGNPHELMEKWRYIRHLEKEYYDFWAHDRRLAGGKVVRG